MPAAHVETARMHHELARGPLKRGAACLKCRKYKLKCDGVKPTCSTCARRVRHADEPCEYESGPRKSRTQSLNDKIKILERDIQLLESSKSSKEPESPPRSESPPPITDDYGARLPKIRQTDPHGYVKSLYRNTSHGLPKFLRKEILPDCVRNHLLTIFLSRRGQCTLQFHVKRFLDSLELPPEQGPHPALLNAMYLIACHFSTSRTLSGCETLFLSRVQKHLAQALAHSDRLFDFILAAGLLSRYYSFKGRLLEAHSTGVTVTRFALGCGLHKIKTREWKKVAQESEKTRTHGRALLIPQPKDSVELGERINAFWMLYINDRIISIGTGLPNAISDDDIETVWPAPMEAFESHTASDTEAGTIRSLYTPAFRASTACLESLEALRAMGVALVDRASWVSTHADYDTAHKDFVCVDRAITEFLRGLPPLRGIYTLLDFPLAFAHTLACAATIQLYRAQVPKMPSLRQKCMIAAKRAVEIVRMKDNIDMSHSTAMFGVIWMGIYEFLASELSRVDDEAQLDQVALIKTDLQTFTRTMRRLSETFPVVGLMVDKMLSATPL